MKRFSYLALFVILGLIFELGIQAVIETAYIALLIANFSVFGLGLTWDQWFTIHKIFTVVLLIVGGLAGVIMGRYWWPKLYDQTGQLRPMPWRKI